MTQCADVLFYKLCKELKKNLIKHAKILYNEFWQHRVTEKALLKKVPQICAYVDLTSSKTKYCTSNVCLLFKFHHATIYYSYFLSLILPLIFDSILPDS